MEQYITYHKIIDKLNDYQKSNPRINSFGYGNLIDFGRNISGDTTEYAFMFVIPQSIIYDENTTTYQLSILFADRLNDDLSNDKDVISDQSLNARDFISQIKRGFLFPYMEIQMPVNAIPFVERFNDYVGGVSIDANIIILEDINACPPYDSDAYILQENTSLILQENNSKINI